VGRHEAITHKIADMAANTYAMESVARVATWMADQGHFDIRLEAAAAKEWNSCRAWEVIDDTMQIRGGRGYETARSLANRGERPIPVEQIMRDYRINKIFEGSSEIMHLFMAREAVDKHLQVAGALIDPEKSFGEKLGAFGRSAAFYAWWYPTRWFGWGRWPRFGAWGALSAHVGWLERTTRRLARAIFHLMASNGPKLEKRQALLFRAVDIGADLFAMSATGSRAQAMRRGRGADAARAAELADVFCRMTRRRIIQRFAAIRSNDDVRKYRTARRLLAGEHLWLERGLVPIGEVEKFAAAAVAAESAETELARV